MASLSSAAQSVAVEEPSGIPRWPRASARARDRAVAIATASAVAGATALALWLRLTGLWGWDGTLTHDEARLALAGRAVLEHGAPVLPTGWVYTRGPVAVYAVAGSFALLGQSDFAARLPSVLAGAALAPIMYLLGRTLAGRWGGVFAALFVAGNAPLVVWSRAAWFPALYVLTYAAALLFIVRAHRGGRARDQLLAGGLVGLTFFCNELGIFLLLPLGAQVTARLWADRRAPRCWGAPLGALGLAAAAAALLWLLVTRLRADTLAGPYGEVAQYLVPHLDAISFAFYSGMLFDWRGLVLVAALLGLPLAAVRPRYEVLILWLALVPPFVYAITLIPDTPEERYGLTLVVVLVALAAQSVAGWADWIRERLPNLGLSSGAVAGLMFAVILALHLDVERALRAGAVPPSAGTWLQQARARGIGPGDLVMTDLPTVVGWYLGDIDYWVRRWEYEKYTLRRDDVARDVHTGAILIRNVSDYQRLVVGPNAGRTLWVFNSGRRQWRELIGYELRDLLDGSARLRLVLGDDVRGQFGLRGRLLRIELP